MAFALPASVRDLAEDRRRALSIAAVAVVHLLLGYALLAGLSVALPARMSEGLALLNVLPAPPPLAERVVAVRARNARRQGAAAPPNLRSKATDVVAPVPIVPPTIPPPIVAAPIAGIGLQASAGAAPFAGPGTGAGGIWHGTGSGSEGDGDGAGGTPVQLISDGIGDADYPSRAFGRGVSGTVHLLFVVGVKGRVTSCVVIQTSGDADLDNGTCKLFIKKLRYRPATNQYGRPVPTELEGFQTWTLHHRSEPDREWTD